MEKRRTLEVPIVLLIQAFFFHAPSKFWQLTNAKSGTEGRAQKVLCVCLVWLDARETGVSKPV